LTQKAPWQKKTARKPRSYSREQKNAQPSY
jgi:hypothetical protein